MREGGDYNLAMILQVFDHSSCRLVSKYVLKHFLEESDKNVITGDDIDNMLAEERLLFEDGRSSIYFIDKDFEVDKEEEKRIRIQTQIRAKKEFYNSNMVQVASENKRDTSNGKKIKKMTEDGEEEKEFDE